MRLTAIVVTLGLMFLSGCDQNPFTSGGADEEAALANPAFAQPFILHIGKDAYSSAVLAASYKGVDTRPTYGAGYNEINFLPCRATSDHSPGSQTIFLAIDGYPFRHEDILAWLVRRQLITNYSYPIHYTQVQFPAYGTDNVFVCPVVMPGMNQYLSPELQAQGLHNGIDLPLLYRKFIEWTYRNRYEADFPGSGTVKMFAGTFTYTMTSVIPGVMVTGVGTGTIKMMLNPDTGKWQADGYQYQDPPLTLE